MEKMFKGMSISEIKELFKQNGFSNQEIREIENGSYDPYREY